MVKKYVINEPTDPIIVNMDEFAIASDDELITHLRFLTNGLGDARTSGGPQHYSRRWETEIAYVRRELGIRQARREQADALRQHHSMDNGPEFISDEFEAASTTHQ